MQNRQQHLRPFRTGFTLMEVLLVLAIMGIIMSMTVPQLLGRQQHANVDATQISIRGVEQALKLYSLDHSGRFPTTEQGLKVLYETDPRDRQWRGPYLEVEPLDAWGKPFQYSFPGTRNPRGADISSAGPDMTPQTNDDIGNWPLEPR
ncbi:type II secretion system major pseudopilin GspG [Planctomicrobium sp. SH661]|uniref:type II secretion system major pseudopilin GspG n=1 Tax=Planctomicrobium sp. SH661 TaxID=3448124 RepID=UPI003F5BCA58